MIGHLVNRHRQQKRIVVRRSYRPLTIAAHSPERCRSFAELYGGFARNWITTAFSPKCDEMAAKWTRAAAHWAAMMLES